MPPKGYTAEVQREVRPWGGGGGGDPVRLAQRLRWGVLSSSGGWYISQVRTA